MAAVGSSFFSQNNNFNNGGFGVDSAGVSGVGAGKKGNYPNYETEIEQFGNFLREFKDEEDNAKYVLLLNEVAHHRQKDLPISLDDVEEYFRLRDSNFVERVKQNTSRYVWVFSKSVDQNLPEVKSEDLAGSLAPSDVWQLHRLHRIDSSIQNDMQYENPEAAETAKNKHVESIPEELRRRYELRILPQKWEKSLKMREIRSHHVGHLVTLSGIVARVSDVQPLIRVVTYVCTVCGYESYQTVNDKQYMPVQLCPSSSCSNNQSNGRLSQMTRGSKFVRYQIVKLQEFPSEVPVGHVPRSISLRVYGEMTRKCKPGDAIHCSGIYLPAPYSGFRAIRAGLTADTYIEVMTIDLTKKRYADTEIDSEMQKTIDEASQDPSIFDQLSASIAPEIYGHESIKKALLLLLAGGVTKQMKDGLKIRGDLNILLMGDPGVAKSQLLKQITTIAPQAVYTTGKGSTGVGLTAAVLRDPVTGDMTLEGGALVLADMGVCCIDEFDKMDEMDRSNLHEVMEQQTVSIAKAGITTTLNARTSILAAANPVFGRWNKRRTVEENVGLPTSLLSRFDLSFVILDTPDEEKDRLLAEHVTYVHRENHAPPLGGVEEKGEDLHFTPQFLRAYISKARNFEPSIPFGSGVISTIIDNYVDMRKKGADEMKDRSQKFESGSSNSRTGFCTARMLLSLLRLSQAHARLHFRHTIQMEDVNVAITLLEATRGALDSDHSNSTAQADYLTAIYNIILNMTNARQSNEVNLTDLHERVVKRGFKEYQLYQTLEEYEQLGILFRHGGKVVVDVQSLTQQLV